MALPADEPDIFSHAARSYRMPWDIARSWSVSSQKPNAGTGSAEHGIVAGGGWQYGY